MEEQEEQQKQATEGKAPKERPVWMTQSTVQGAYNEPDILKTRKSEILFTQLVSRIQIYASQRKKINVKKYFFLDWVPLNYLIWMYKFPVLWEQDQEARS